MKIFKLAIRLAWTVLAIAAVGSAASDALAQHVESSRRSSQLRGRVSIQAVVNGLFVTVQPDNTLAARSSAVGTSEQFDVYDFGDGAVGLKSVAAGKYVTADRAAPLIASSISLDGAERFTSISGARDLTRLRARDLGSFVCADQAGAALMMRGSSCAYGRYNRQR
jgi:hypothetical protein